ncbi:serine hydrolase domain-containing protein [Granulicella sp. dw_53]|uniref:serine hydrolase domain-containing protein n=1 Tax=Granulicella sp. dw_53 TaxID=2719792 RepID=UPI001BD6C4DD|nr:serine hydrolase domain-containing protein [Granulicella sp. dw_53]
MVGRGFVLGFVLLLGVSVSELLGQQALSPEMRGKVDAAVKQVMEKTGVPSASVGIVQGGRVVYTEAFGRARLSPELMAKPEMHYAVGSISKQFTAACVLLLAEDGKLTLDDPVSKWFPELTRANEVTVRNLLTHTSGYEDYAPQDYTIPAWTKAIKPLELVHTWAGKPLDFDPGTKWQYSNTNFELAGLIVEKASGMPFWRFLETRVLKPLGLKEVLNLDTDRRRMEPSGYMRNALGPLRPTKLEAPGWYFADGALSMPVETLLRWDISVMDQTLLTPASYAAFEQEMKLKDGTGTSYGMGVSVGVRNGRRVVSHTGEVGGFVAANAVYPDDKVAVAVLTNQEASSTAGQIQRAIAALVLPVAASGDHAEAEAQVKAVLTGLQQGKIDRGLFTADCNFYFTQETIGDFQSSLAPLGEVKTVTEGGESLRGGMTFRSFVVGFSGGTAVTVTTYTTSDGKLEQFLVEGKS